MIYLIALPVWAAYVLVILHLVALVASLKKAMDWESGIPKFLWVIGLVAIPILPYFFLIINLVNKAGKNGRNKLAV